jgi:hypothetical protein
MAIMWNIFTAVLCAALGFSQSVPPKDGSRAQETKHLAVTTSSSPQVPVPGKRVTLAVDVAPKPKMHVYSPGQEGYIVLTLTLDADPAFTAAKAKYPPGEKIYMAILKETQLVYVKPFRITQDVTPKSGATGTVTVKGTLRYQACDDTTCYLPTTVPLVWNLTLAPGK